MFIAIAQWKRWVGELVAVVKIFSSFCKVEVTSDLVLHCVNESYALNVDLAKTLVEYERSHCCKW